MGDDAPAGDGPLAQTVCDLSVEPDLVALFGFEPDLGSEVTGQHPGMVRGVVLAKPGRCGTTAAGFGSGHLLVPHASAFDLATGSIELFVRTPAPAIAENQALLSRDAELALTDGHLLLMLNTVGEVVVRIQRGEMSYYRCAPAIPADTWVHIGLSFGGTGAQGLRMWVDHVEATLTTSILLGPIDCTGVPPPGGIQGNSNTLVLGANNGRAEDGSTDPGVEQPLFGELDQVRIRSTWRDFGAP